MHIHVPTCRDMLLFISRTIYAYLKKYNIAKLNKITVLSPPKKVKILQCGQKNTIFDKYHGVRATIQPKTVDKQYNWVYQI